MLDIIFLRAVVDILVLVLPTMAMLIIPLQQPWNSWQVRVRNIMFRCIFLGDLHFQRYYKLCYDLS